MVLGLLPSQPYIGLAMAADGEDAYAFTLLQVYYYCSLFKDNVEASSLNARQKAAVNHIMRERWDFLHNDLHGAAFCMNPEFWEMKLNSEVSRL